MTTAVAILNQKGGSGKTPITIKLAGALTSFGKSVLVFDLDGQGDLTTGVGFDDEVFADNGSKIYTLLTDSLYDVLAVIRPAPPDRFDLVPGNIQIELVPILWTASRTQLESCQTISKDSPGANRVK